MSSESIKDTLNADSANRFPDNNQRFIKAVALREHLATLTEFVAKLISANEIGVGDSTTTGDKTITFETGAANQPKIRYNVTTSKFEYTEDGTTFLGFSSVGNFDNGGIIFFNGSELSSSPVFIYDEANARIGVGEITPTGKLEVKGTEDVVQLILKGNTTQTQDFYQIKKSSGEVLESLSSNYVKKLPKALATPSVEAGYFKFFGLNHNGAGTLSPYFLTEDGKTISLRKAELKEFTVKFGVNLETEYTITGLVGNTYEFISLSFGIRISSVALQVRDVTLGDDNTPWVSVVDIAALNSFVATLGPGSDWDLRQIAVLNYPDYSTGTTKLIYREK